MLILSSWFDDYNSHFVETFSAVVMWLAKHFDRKTHWPLAKSFHAGNYGIFVFSRENFFEDTFEFYRFENQIAIVRGSM